MFGNSMFNNQNEPEKDEILKSSDDEILKGEVLENGANFKIIDENADEKKDEILNKKANENLKFSVDENLKKDETTQDNMDFKIIDENAD